MYDIIILSHTKHDFFFPFYFKIHYQQLKNTYPFSTKMKIRGNTFQFQKYTPAVCGNFHAKFEEKVHIFDALKVSLFMRRMRHLLARCPHPFEIGVNNKITLNGL